MNNNSQYNVNDNDRIMEEDEEELQKDIDPEFSKILKSLAEPLEPVSEATKQKVMDGYDREYRYKIFWLQTKAKIENYRKELFIGNGRRLEISLAAIIVFFILATIAYYQYTKPQSTPTNIIANQETPIIKISPNPTDTPIATPSPTESIDPKVATNPNNNDNIRQDGTKEENNQQTITNQDVKSRKPQETKGLDKENDKIAMTTKPKDNREERNIRDISKKRDNSINRNNNDVKNERLTLSNLVYVAVKDLKIDKQELNAIDIEIKDELIKAINDNGKWELSSVQDDKTQAIFYKQNADGALVLFDKKERTPLWQDLNYIENYKKDKNYIKLIVKMLENHKDENPQKK